MTRCFALLQTDPIMFNSSSSAEAFKKLYDVVVRLRSPEGCPWDLEQTPLSLRGDLIEETYECIEAIDEGNPGHIKEELGDIFLLAAMIAYMHEQKGLFSVAGVLEGIAEKLVRRHPHVFGPSSGETSFVGEQKAQTAEAAGESNGGGPALSSSQVLQNWAKIKVEQEGRKPKDSVLDEVSRGLPPLDRAWKLQKKAAKAGFDWPDAAGVIAKIREELEEVEAAIAEESAAASAAPETPADRSAANFTGTKGASPLEGELGDLLFSVINLCRFFNIEPSIALQQTNIKFTERFKYVEKRMKESGQEMNAQNLAVMDRYWNEAK